jgi:hypothetical protein
MTEYFRAETVLDVMFGRVAVGITDIQELTRLLARLGLNEAAHISTKLSIAALDLQKLLPDLYDTQGVDALGYGTVRALTQHLYGMIEVPTPQTTDATGKE